MYVTSDERYLYIRVDTAGISEDKATYLLFDTIKNQGQSTVVDEPGSDDFRSGFRPSDKRNQRSAHVGGQLL